MKRNELAEDLRRAMDELTDPGLTLARAEILRPRVARIIEAIRESERMPLDRHREVHPPHQSGRRMGDFRRCKPFCMAEPLGV
ncbi:hypothetical protein P12x_005624 [Tundrisphaera lichenicola]|uniref:hypothetical protein n=1 Tax=Tundrisphaera lichenicola TaxID=2029860 RepID=UPI003EBF7E00